MGQLPIQEIKCPKCGETRMSKVLEIRAWHVILSILTLGLYAVVYAIWSLKMGDRQIKPGDRIKCLNCKTRWVYEG
jgi:DNA-directed RNA polymerase subunit RPC12/RpoP